MVRVEGLSEKEIEEKERAKKMTGIVQQVLGDKYTAMTHSRYISALRKLSGSLIYVSLREEVVEASSPSVREDALRLAHQLENTYGGEYVLKLNYV